MIHTYSKLCNFYRKINNFDNIASIIHWDMSTNIPKDSMKYRSEELATLQSMTHKLLISEQFGDLLSSVKKARLNDWQKANLNEMHNIRKNALAVETRLLEVHTKTAAECEMLWRQARKDNDFKSLIPVFRKVISITKDIGDSRGDYLGMSTYDALLDQYDPGRKSADINKIFSEITKFLPNLVNKIIEKQSKNNSKPLPNHKFPIAKQEELGRFIMKALGFNFDRGRLDVSTHPFCGGNPHDVRITTRYAENDFSSGLMGVVHETGHALYEQNLPADYIDQPVGKNLGMSIHESQSLLMEMQISRSKEFFEFITPKIVELFALDPREWSADRIYTSRTKVKKTLIRVDADEATYPLHVILRYNIEKELLTGNLQIRDLPAVWNDGMKSLLGVVPEKNSMGCMQDIHWYMGAFGYFPTYTLGALAAAQFYQALAREVKDHTQYIRKGDFKPITSWLHKNIHNQGRFYSADQLVKKVTGKNIEIAAYKKHIETRYL